MEKQEAHRLQRQTSAWPLTLFAVCVSLGKFLILSELQGRYCHLPKSLLPSLLLEEPSFVCRSRERFLTSRKAGLSFSSGNESLYKSIMVIPFLTSSDRVQDSVCDPFLKPWEVKGSLLWRFLPWIKGRTSWGDRPCFFLPAWDPGVQRRCLGLRQPSCNYEARSMKTKSQYAKKGKKMDRILDLDDTVELLHRHWTPHLLKAYSTVTCSQKLS